MKKNIKWLLLVSLTFMACNNDDNDAAAEVPVVPGSAVFTKYVALGDSFAAGYSDGALFAKGQTNSYTNILSQQFVAAGGGAFTTPMMVDNVGGFSSGGVQIPKFPTRYIFNPKTSSPVNVPGVSGTVITTHLTGTFNNMGVPGAKSFHLIAPGYGNLAGVFTTPATANPYFARFSSSATTSILADAMAQTPTFFSLFIGGNDVLGYATNGGVPTSQDPVLGDDITPTATFNFAYNTLVTTLTANGAKGVVANLPYITSLPYFTTVPYNPIALDATKAGLLNSGYAAYNAGLVQMKNLNLITADELAKRTINFVTGNNAVVIVDSYLTNLSAYKIPSYRQATKEDLVVLLASNFIKESVLAGDPTKINGASLPLADKWVLTKDEVDEVKKATDEYNTIIAATAESKGLAFVDTKATLTKLSSGGIRFGTFVMTSSYAVGGAFSLDGVHPSPRGYGLIANIFIDAINAKYGSTLRHVDLASYPIQYPAVIQ
jgi:lysophospholipase L1-like esterase